MTKLLCPPPGVDMRNNAKLHLMSTPGGGHGSETTKQSHHPCKNHEILRFAQNNRRVFRMTKRYHSHTPVIPIPLCHSRESGNPVSRRFAFQFRVVSRKIALAILNWTKTFFFCKIDVMDK
jgi:hypothetical protein